MKKNDKRNSYSRMFKGMVDLGASTGLASPSLARFLHLPIEPHIDGRQIGTADADGSLTIVGWITIPGYAGRIALVEGAAFILLSVIHLQQNGMGVHCPPLSTTCRLTVIEERVEVEFMELQQEPPTNLFFVDIRLLYYDCLPLFVPQVNDYDGPEPTIYGGHARYCSPNSRSHYENADAVHCLHLDRYCKESLQIHRTEGRNACTKQNKNSTHCNPPNHTVISDVK